MTRLASILLLLLAALVAGCATRDPLAVPVRCRVHGPLPDPRCTPGAVDPRITQDNIHKTVCERGYTRRVRPSAGYTERLKRIQLAAYGFYVGKAARAYEEDHLIPLELGGAPQDARNLWPERRAGAAGSNAKDAEENLLHRRVCQGEEPLATAQHEVASDWYAAYLRDRPGT